MARQLPLVLQRQGPQLALVALLQAWPMARRPQHLGLPQPLQDKDKQQRTQEGWVQHQEQLQQQGRTCLGRQRKRGFGADTRRSVRRKECPSRWG